MGYGFQGQGQITTPATCLLLERVEQTVYTDHVSVWVSDTGTQFVLNEPYGKTYVDEGDKLLDAGLVRIKLPTSLSPYCGGSSNVQGAQPGTRSFLIGFKRYEAELLAIAEKLRTAAAGAPAWNDTTGVT